ncbi:MAG TPA: fatty acid desaturase, partial [Polyangiaceae bacterium]|nr:fatty acid desaturase [Polyangiaceae bacterium]
MTPPLGASTAAVARAPRGHPAGGPAPAAQVGWTQAAIRADIADVRRQCAELGRGDELAALQRPRPGAVFGPAAASWLAVFSAWWCVVAVSPALWPLALVVVASRQRALGNALHDAAHGNGVRSTRLNQWLLAVPMFEDFEHYRRDHLLHHAHLGDAALDPDYLAPTEGAPPSASVLYARAALAPRRWRESALGQLPGLSWAARGRAALWWACLLSGVAGLGAA